jgi:hypothetical protein
MRPVRALDENGIADAKAFVALRYDARNGHKTSILDGKRVFHDE